METSLLNVNESALAIAESKVISHIEQSTLKRAAYAMLSRAFRVESVLMSKENLDAAAHYAVYGLSFGKQQTINVLRDMQIVAVTAGQIEPNDLIVFNFAFESYRWASFEHELIDLPARKVERLVTRFKVAVNANNFVVFNLNKSEVQVSKAYGTLTSAIPNVPESTDASVYFQTFIMGLIAKTIKRANAGNMPLKQRITHLPTNGNITLYGRYVEAQNRARNERKALREAQAQGNTPSDIAIIGDFVNDPELDLTAIQ